MNPEPEDPFDEGHTDALLVAYADGTEFVEALYRLAQRAGIKLNPPPDHPVTGWTDPVT